MEIVQNQVIVAQSKPASAKNQISQSEAVQIVGSLSTICAMLERVTVNQNEEDMTSNMSGVV